MDIHPTSNYMIRTMCGGESPYKSEQQQQLIDQGLIPNPLYHSGAQRLPGPDRLGSSQAPSSCGLPMSRPLASIGPAGVVNQSFCPLTNGSSKAIAATNPGRPYSRNGLSASANGCVQTAVDNDSAVNAVRLLVGDRDPPGVPVDGPSARASRAARSGQNARNSIERASAPENSADSEVYFILKEEDGQSPPPVTGHGRQVNSRRSSGDSCRSGGIPNGGSAPTGNRPSIKRCASDESEEDPTKKDLKRSMSGGQREVGVSETAVESPVGEAIDLEACVVAPQPKKRGRRKKSEILAAQAMLSENAKNVQVGAIISAVMDDVRRAGREKKPFDPWADRKASGKAFVQDGPCFALLDVTSKKFPKCSSCRVNDEVNECRFSEFRKLRFVGDLVQVDGFTDSDDARESDRRIWMTTDLGPEDSIDTNDAGQGSKRQFVKAEGPAQNSAINRLDEKTAIMVLTNVGDIMCDLVREEAEVRSEYIEWMPTEGDAEGAEVKIKWRRVYGVREMCDVCSTTIFNLHWTCGQCGFVACIDCFRTRARREEAHSQASNPTSAGANGNQGQSPPGGQPAPRRNRDQHLLYPDKDEYRWLYCGNPKAQRSHSPRKLLMTQIVPGDILERVNRQQHEVRRQRGIPMRCGCNAEDPAGQLVQANRAVPSSLASIEAADREARALTKPAQRLAAVSRLKKLMAPASNEVAFKRLLVNEMDRAAGRKPANASIMNSMGRKGTGDMADLRVLADIATQRTGSVIKTEPQTAAESVHANPSVTAGFSRIHAIASAVLETRLGPEQRRPVYRLPVSVHRLQSLAPRVGQMSEGRRMYAAPHEWLCNGKLLLLLEATHPQNLELFQEQWNRGQPVVVAHVSEVLDMNLWRPDAFLRDFGEQKSTLVDCKTGADLGKPIPMKRFWEGFECFAKRLCDKNGDHMLLKLKDWPPDENFSEVLPTRYADLMRALPLPMYTLREGSLNLANRLPTCFVPPDLGPKMYNAYGSALFPTKGTTNLHLDMSDAANVMVYVGIPRDGNCQRHIEEALRAVEEAGCDATQMKRVREKGAKVGAVWHIFHAQDAEKIRELLKQVMVERGQRIEAHSDPIHDQLWYLDSELRRRLLQEKGVRGYAIAQCVGDAVFIPAGAPHQVRNLHSCIKVAEDFVSPENLAHCLKLTNEFRFLSDTHTNHEDKLQIKNVVYHAVKDAVSVLDEGDKPCAESC